MKAAGGPVRVDALLPKVLDQHGLRERLGRMEALEAWPEIVGETVAAVTGVRAVEKEALIVEVRSSAWLMELSMMKEDFLRRVNDRLKDAPLKRIVFVLAETS